LAAEAQQRPAFYALRPGGWRDLITLLHPPYTLWHLGYVALGAAAAPQLHADRLLAALAAFFLAVGIGAHALDELHGRPLATRISRQTLLGLAYMGLGGALAIGVVGTLIVSATLAPLVIAGGFMVPAYNLELFGGRFHTDFWFAASWGAFPALAGWWSNALAIHSPRQALAAATVVVGCFWLSVAQRRLSAPVRELRRRTVEVSGVQQLVSGKLRKLDRASLVSPLDGALRALSVAVPLLAIGAVAIRI
jgi:hypothetical protein